MAVTFLFHPSERRKEALRQVSAAAGVPMGEMLRRMIDHCCRQEVLNVMLPHLSGAIDLGRREGR